MNEIQTNESTAVPEGKDGQKITYPERGRSMISGNAELFVQGLVESHGMTVANLLGTFQSMEAASIPDQCVEGLVEESFRVAGIRNGLPEDQFYKLRDRVIEMWKSLP